jgi:predicted nucleic acid-binding protein
MILLDTSLLIDALSGPRRSAKPLRATLAAGERIALPALVLYEWLRGPRLREELEAQETLFPRASAVGFDAEEAAIAADLYARVRHPRGRELDLAIAACAITRTASLWTLNVNDFVDVPGLTLYRAP